MKIYYQTPSERHDNAAPLLWFELKPPYREVDRFDRQRVRWTYRSLRSLHGPMISRWILCDLLFLEPHQRTGRIPR